MWGGLTWKVPLAPFPVMRSSCPRSTALTRAVLSTSGLDTNTVTAGGRQALRGLPSPPAAYLLSILRWGKCCSRYFLIRL